MGGSMAAARVEAARVAARVGADTAQSREGMVVATAAARAEVARVVARVEVD